MPYEPHHTYTHKLLKNACYVVEGPHCHQKRAFFLFHISALICLFLLYPSVFFSRFLLLSACQIISHSASLPPSLFRSLSPFPPFPSPPLLSPQGRCGSDLSRGLISGFLRTRGKRKSWRPITSQLKTWNHDIV